MEIESVKRNQKDLQSKRKAVRLHYDVVDVSVMLLHNFLLCEMKEEEER